MGSRIAGSMFSVCASVCQCGEYAVVVGQGVFCQAEMYFEYEIGESERGSGR